MDEPVENLIEAALFFKGGAISMKELAKSLGLSLDITEEGVVSLAASLEGRGLRVVREGDTVALGTAPAAHELVEKMRREELEGPLGKAGLETLSVIIYRGASSRADIEYVRGVNSSSILRSLLIRGLIERIDNPDDKRSYLYRATAELPAFFGIGSLSELPAYQETKEAIERVFAERATLLAEAPEEGHETAV
jgi:segregation and condensation protein B